MTKRAVLAFDHQLERLFDDRTHWLKAQVRKPGVGKAPTFGRSKVNKAIRQLKKQASLCLLPKYRGREFRKLYDNKKQWQVKSKGWGLDRKRRSFDVWFERYIPHTNCVYLFWAGRKCRYIGRTLKGKGRPQSHFEKAWFGAVTRIDILSCKKARNVPKLECIATHRFDPTYSKIKPAAKKWAAKCPICETHKRIRNEVRSLFRLK
jgi:hypothetical protein